MADGGPVENEGSPPGVYALRELDPLEDVGPVTGGTQGGAMHGGVLVRRSTRPGSSPTSEYSPNVPAVLFKDNSIGVNRQSHAYSSLYRPASVHDGHTIEQGGAQPIRCVTCRLPTGPVLRTTVRSNVGSADAAEQAR